MAVRAPPARKTSFFSMVGPPGVGLRGRTRAARQVMIARGTGGATRGEGKATLRSILRRRKPAHGEDHRKAGAPAARSESGKERLQEAHARGHVKTRVAGWGW